ncbi:MAG: FadR/GntR family transcriptional regulator [Segniliparus sp.]|uniref:FadR/GntR family transcriptional regulator n=1 Tax=Segniliparus sp. TaxID=2804064 RepID=UPI003F3B0FD1
MTFSPIQRTSVADSVFAQISAQVLDGRLAPGNGLPGERALAEAFGVSRPVVREAIQKLSQAGLVATRHGEGTTVVDYRREAGPELLPALLVRDGSPDPKVIRSVAEVREVLGAEEDPVGKQRLALAYWDVLVDGADSIAHRLMANSLWKAYEPAIEALAVVLSSEVGAAGAYAGLAVAVADGDEAEARSLARQLLARGTSALEALATTLEEGALS